MEAESEDKGEEESKDKEEETTEEELNKTIRSEQIGRKRRGPRIFLILLLLLVVACLCIYFIPDCEPLRNEISAIVSNII